MAQEALLQDQITEELDIDTLFSELAYPIKAVLEENDLINMHNMAMIEERIYDLANFIMNSQEEGARD